MAWSSSAPLRHGHLCFVINLKLDTQLLPLHRLLFALWVVAVETTSDTDDELWHEVQVTSGLWMKILTDSDSCCHCSKVRSQETANLHVPVVTRTHVTQLLMWIKWCNLKYLPTKVIACSCYMHFYVQLWQSQKFVIWSCTTPNNFFNWYEPPESNWLTVCLPSALWSISAPFQHYFGFPAHSYCLVSVVLLLSAFLAVEKTFSKDEKPLWAIPWNHADRQS